MAAERGAGAEFRRDLLDVLDGEARLAALVVLAEWGGTVVYLPRSSARERRLAVARQLLAEGVARAAAVQALIARFGISASTAWRDLEMSQGS